MLARKRCAAAAREPRTAARAGMRGGDGAPWVIEPLHPRVLVVPHLRPRERHRRPALPRAGPAAGQRAPFPARAPLRRQGAGSFKVGGRKGRAVDLAARMVPPRRPARRGAKRQRAQGSQSKRGAGAGAHGEVGRRELELEVLRARRGIAAKPRGYQTRANDTAPVSPARAPAQLHAGRQWIWMRCRGGPAQVPQVGAERRHVFKVVRLRRKQRKRHWKIRPAHTRRTVRRARTKMKALGCGAKSRASGAPM